MYDDDYYGMLFIHHDPREFALTAWEIRCRLAYFIAVAEDDSRWD